MGRVKSRGTAQAALSNVKSHTTPFAHCLRAPWPITRGWGRRSSQLASPASMQSSWSKLLSSHALRRRRPASRKSSTGDRTQKGVCRAG